MLKFNYVLAFLFAAIIFFAVSCSEHVAPAPADVQRSTGSEPARSAEPVAVENTGQGQDVPVATNREHNRRHLKKIREELHELHEEIDEIFFGIEKDPKEALEEDLVQDEPEKDDGEPNR